LIKTLIFDVDGTLAETEEYHRRAFNVAFEEFGLDWVWDDALYRDLLKVTGGKERIAHYIFRTGAMKDSMDPDGRSLAFLLHQKKTAIYTEMVRTGAVPLRAGIGDFLCAAAENGIGLAIATTTSLPNIEALLGATLGSQWRRMFPVVAAGDMVVNKKPAPDVYQLAVNLLDQNAEDCIAIEDSRNGVQSALAAGLRVVAVRSDFARDDDLQGSIRQLPDCTWLSLELLREIA